MLNIKIQKLSHAKNIPLPNYSSENCSGLDLYAAIKNKIKIKNGEIITIPTGIKIALKKNLEAQVRPRSGLAANFGITVLNTPGTIDADYRGEIKIVLINHGNTEFRVSKDSRIAQLIFEKFSPNTLLTGVYSNKTVVESNNSNQRLDGGFGSTG